MGKENDDENKEAKEKRSLECPNKSCQACYQVELLSIEILSTFLTDYTLTCCVVKTIL